MFLLKTILVILIVCQMEHSSAYKILAIFPSMSRSHFIVGKQLLEELASIGHNVTVLSPYPRLNRIHNYHDIDVQGVHEKVTRKLPNFLKVSKFNWFQAFEFDYLLGSIITKHTLNHEKVQMLLNDTNEKYDLVIQEAFLNEALHGIAYHFKAPIISLSTLGSSIWTNYMVGNPTPLSYVSNFLLPFADKKTFHERLQNTFFAIAEYIYYMHIYWPMQSQIYDNTFPGNKPSLWDLHRNISLVLLNTHFVLNYPLPYMPNTIEVGGLQINRNSTNLSKNLKEILDNASNGVIYFSLGSNVRSVDFTMNQTKILATVFSKFKQTILWKWDDLNVPDLSENVIIRNWFPQEQILAHKNVKLFITHCGLLSVTEAIFNAVPILGIPLFADQVMNMVKLTNENIGLMIKFDDITIDSLWKSINELINNEKYSKNMKRISQLYRDQPMPPIQTAIYWIEYVARYKGAPHLRSAAQDLNFIQYNNLDVLAFIVGTLIIGMLFLIFIIKYLCFKKRSIGTNKKFN